MRLASIEKRLFRFIAAHNRKFGFGPYVHQAEEISASALVWLVQFRLVFKGRRVTLTEKGRSLAIALLGPEREESPNRPNPVRQHEEILAIYAACIKRDGPPTVIRCDR